MCHKAQLFRVTNQLQHTSINLEILTLVGGLEHFLFSHILGSNHPNWLSYFSEGFKPPTRIYSFPKFGKSMDWFKGKSIWNHRFCHHLFFFPGSHVPTDVKRWMISHENIQRHVPTKYILKYHKISHWIPLIMEKNDNKSFLATINHF